MAKRIFKLLDHEAMLKMAETQEPVVLVTFYDTSNAAEAEISTAALYNRMLDIVRANTWLMARAMKVKDGKTVIVQLELDELNEKPENYVKRVTDDLVFEAYTQSYSKLGNAVYKYAGKVGKKSMGVSGDSKQPGLPLTNFAIIENSDKTKMCAMVSVNHIIGDGATIYTLYKMLDTSEEVLRLNPERVQNYGELVPSNLSVFSSRGDGTMKTNLEDTQDMFKAFGPAMVMNGIGNMFKGVSPAGYLYLVNKEKVAEIKSKYNTENSFVSTNDVLTSWFADVIGPTADNIHMAINVRGRIPEIAADRAGNYVCAPPFKKDQLETPVTVRAALNNFLKPGFAWPSGTYSEYRKFGGGIHTSWVRFYHHVEPAGFKQVRHMPVAKNLAERLGPIALSMAAVLVTYMSNRDELAVLVVSLTKCLTKNKLDKEDILECRVMSW